MEQRKNVLKVTLLYLIICKRMSRFMPQILPTFSTKMFMRGRIKFCITMTLNDPSMELTTTCRQSRFTKIWVCGRNKDGMLFCGYQPRNWLTRKCRAERRRKEVNDEFLLYGHGWLATLTPLWKSAKKQGWCVMGCWYIAHASLDWDWWPVYFSTPPIELSKFGNISMKVVLHKAAFADKIKGLPDFAKAREEDHGVCLVYVYMMDNGHDTIVS